MEAKLNNTYLKKTANIPLESQCLFIQKWRELLFQKTINTYQFRLRNSHSILKETKEVLEFIKSDILSPANLQDLILECRKHLQKDLCLRNHFPELLNSLLKELRVIKKNETTKSDILKLEYRLNYALKIISGSYLDKIIIELENAISNSEFTNVEILTEFLSTELINSGWSARSLHRLGKVLFLNSKLEFEEKWQTFISIIKSNPGLFHCYYKLNEINDQYTLLESVGMTVVKGEDILISFPNINNNHIDKDALYIEEKAAAFSEDLHTAAEKSRNQLSEKQSILAYYKVDLGAFNNVTLVFPSEEKSVNYQILKKELSLEDSQNENINTIRAVLVNESIEIKSRQRLMNFFRQYNLSVESLSTEIKFTNLWSALESLLITGHHESNIDHIKKIVPSAVCSEYFQRLLFNFLNDCCRADIIVEYNGEIINTSSPTIEDVEKVYLLLTDEVSVEVFKSEINDYTLLKQRIIELSHDLSNSKTFKESISNHFNNLTWHIQRLYRVRNNLVHAARTEKDISFLIEHLHYYLRYTIELIISKFKDFQFNSLGELFMTIEDNYYSLIAVLEDNIRNSPKGGIISYDSELIFKGPIFI
ncbi:MULTISPECIES: hypothetical protein [Bacillus cereus group]|uniref:hypothetical protein n=1 Tax=Bacillus cereus group TaxID=86661 RepID=UPI000279EED2|nr:hypothetical protein [Bacillus cereus]EJR28502.1 hypothetical protein IIE_05341 [Bacillus cereus VD045]HDR4351237.1 hypothetical protein [Bacillus cereus]HDR6958292.1 hypothetical protein [Bacillus cereus]